MQMDYSAVALALLLISTWVVMKYLPRLLAGVPFVPPAELKAALDAKEDVLVVDVRSPREFTDPMGHIPGALNLPVDQAKGRIEEMKDQLAGYRDTPVYVACRTTNRSPHAARWLRQAGLKNVRVVNGGTKKWVDLGYPTER